MKILKVVLWVVVILIAIPLVLALFVKKSYSVEREVTINKPEHEVFDYIRMLKNQDNYSKWSTMDPDMKQNYEGVDGTPGFVSSWDSEKRDVGKGEQTIVNVVEGEKIDYELHFIEPFEARAQAYMETEPVTDSSTTVKWGFSSKMNYPMNVMLLFMNMEEMISKDLDEGLGNLKDIMEG